MITKFMSEVTTRFNPFSPNARSARLFLSLLPPNARKSIVVNTTLLPQKSTEPSSLRVKFSASPPRFPLLLLLGWVVPRAGRHCGWLTVVRRGWPGDEPGVREVYDKEPGGGGGSALAEAAEAG